VTDAPASVSARRPAMPADAGWRPSSPRDAALFTAYLRGAGDVEAAAEAGVSRSTAQRWKRRHLEALRSAADEQVTEAIAGLRSTLGAGWRRLLLEIGNPANGPVGVSAVRAAYAAYRDLTTHIDLEARLAELERLVATRPPSRTVQ